MSDVPDARGCAGRVVPNGSQAVCPATSGVVGYDDRRPRPPDYGLTTVVQDIEQMNNLACLLGASQGKVEAAGMSRARSGYMASPGKAVI
jgi:hypothetical protein